MCEKIPKTKKIKVKKGVSLRTFYKMAALLHIRQEMKKVYREEDVRIAMQISAAILIICFIVSRF